ncbi:hypothetical protein SAMN04487770_13645 [Butyrivibrio sp. ob235]|uniref:hypothetical protein n=1 Tax=Butyrivibrio sp. ob235 TaxID=1761780 RepID=UPI0008C8770E|nr:hypothetical protein [Butyrivibrio sp. ob235]SEM39230.1 hypothetical protein SAMN04487770_13645 [Butyrivibrio sp. ob235]
MGEYEVMEIEYSETTIESGNIIADIAVQFGIAIAAVIVGNAICYGIGKAFDAFNEAISENEKIINTTEEQAS